MVSRFVALVVASIALPLASCAELQPPPLYDAASDDDRLREALAALQRGDGETAWFRLWDLAIEGDPAAQVELARLYREGTGIPADARIERRWIERAAVSGHPLAQYRLGEIYESIGGDGVNRQAAALWYERSADQGYSPARHALSRLRSSLASPY